MLLSTIMTGHPTIFHLTFSVNTKNMKLQKSSGMINYIVGPMKNKF